MLDRAKHSAAQLARKTGLLTGGLLCIAVGAGFLTVAAWIALASAYDALMAAGITGAVYVGVGFVIIGLAGSGPRGQMPQPEPKPKSAPRPSSAPPLMQAFLHGMQAGAEADLGRR
ncbi:phage holin family protein [Roseovarius sp. LXJ103]|uniref:phage holin family protein n=1 Tax=Roseovarius carneus TaxID=2853164 RepID=UPI000D605534|nr:phage holin family protein [Roseovarius carneus]MBZ8118932.1 phage holin family protein [Roseovarius carneus]PWE35413.1 hypothetical protein DD563_05200 [Pelagicola sp. LXJ1103]